ncbi:MAG: excinuclease ABC subunit UvrA, partial [Planctomycetes bacterium]|nr:excinuclease ABC subunit UvrA [Planctomycetota bacterium]
QVGAQLQGVLYVLDEPSIGLHQRDNRRLLDTLKRLRDRGNTVLVVEHDRDTMLAADFLVDVGPGAGARGGEIVASGLPEEVFRHETSLTAAYLRGERQIEMPARRRKGNGAALVIRGARQHNLKNIDVSIPLGCCVAVTGVSGSGKSTLIDLVLKRALARRLHGARDPVGEHDAIDGVEHVDKVVEIDQSPIGRTPRSNPATYSGAFTHVRELFALLPEARARGYARGRFSFNVDGGRCPECAGAGAQLVEMQFLADIEVPCAECNGRRFNAETLDIRYKEKSISDVLDLTVEEAARFFAAHPKLSRILGTLEDVGLGYVRLGQTATTLSGGEAQRLKLARELARPGTGRTLYLLDEPTTGLHFADIERLLSALQALVDCGNTVVVIEHNLDVVKVADWIIDLGPEGGGGGGEVVFAGTPARAMRSRRSWTGRLLKEYLLPARPNPSPVVREAGAGEDRAIRVRGAQKNNLRALDADIPHGALTVVTGVSGSGKTSLAFDTVFAEAQRRFVESMSTYARRFLKRLDRAPVERIDGLAPAIAIDRRAASRNPRSTVATSTEIHDYLRLLFARAGTPHCPDCGAELCAATPGAAAREVLERMAGKRVRVLAPLRRADFRAPPALAPAAGLPEVAADLLKQGFVRVDLDGVEQRLDGPLPSHDPGSVELVIDRVAARPAAAGRIAEAVAQAYGRGNGVAVLRDEEGAELILTREPACPRHGWLLREEPRPRFFSFNSHLGACETCSGLGRVERCDPDLLIAHPEKPLLQGALAPPWDVDLAKPHYGFTHVLASLAQALAIDLDQPFASLRPAARRAILHGYKKPLAIEIVRESHDRRREYSFEAHWEGLCGRFEQKYRAAEEGSWWRRRLRPFMAEGECAACGGARLNPLARAFTAGGRTLDQICRMTVAAAREFFRDLRLDGARAAVAREVVVEIQNRLDVLHGVGLSYLELCRRSATLSGGEAQRIRLATQLGNRLVGVIYVLDEPTIGLHSRDTARLVATLKGLRDLGNTILVVEHDLDVMRAADYLIDVGPGAGQRGGTVVAAGTVAEVRENPASLTGAYLAGRRAVPVPAARRPLGAAAVAVRGARLHNLKSIDAAIPQRALTCVTGVSGSGKSTLVMDVLEPAVRARLASPGRAPPRGGEPFDALVLAPGIEHLAVVDQSPLGPTPASNPATYTGIFDQVREVFAATPEARMKGFSKAWFSFNQPGGRCEACEGKGLVQVEMHFLSDVYVPCEACGGKRFSRETLAVTYGGKSVADVLDMEVEEALRFFANRRRIRDVLALLADIGLRYLRLGQSATTLSGGEAQRVKLAAELGGPRRGAALYLLDEPTTGLHPEDVARLSEVLARLVEAGNTVVVIEHHPDLIKTADYVIDLGPEGGEEGGFIVARGRPEEVARDARSATGGRLARGLRGEACSALAEEGA